MAISKCFLCGDYGRMEDHHLFGGSNRKNSEKYNLVVKLCPIKCHREGPKAVHNCKETMDTLHEYGQLKFMREQNATIEDFRKIFGRNYVEDDEMNECHFTGRIVRAPELRHTKDGIPVCTFAVAVAKGYGDKQRTVFPEFTVWRKTAEFAATLPKGIMVAISGEYDERPWTDRDGNKRKSSEFEVGTLEVMEWGKMPSADRMPEGSPEGSPEADEKAETPTAPISNAYAAYADDDELPF